jgi:hypothetical protein
MASTTKKPDSAVDTSSATEPEICTVANGRTVITDDGSFGPGDEVILNAADADRFRMLGFVLDEDGTAKVRIDGPATVAGAEIKEK